MAAFHIGKRHLCEYLRRLFSYLYRAAGDTGYYIKVIATGSGGYSDYAVSNPIGPVTSGILTAIADNRDDCSTHADRRSGNACRATVDYQWQYSDVEGVTYTDIPLANSSTYYILDLQYSYCYLRVIATGTGSFAGSANATTATRVSGSSTPITNIEPITGTARVSQLLAAGDITPSAATVIYQWQRGATENGTFTDIPGATSGTYKLQDDDYGYYIKVVAMGTGGYSETLNAVTAAPVAAGIVTDIDPIGGTSAIGRIGCRYALCHPKPPSLTGGAFRIGKWYLCKYLRSCL